MRRGSFIVLIIEDANQYSSPQRLVHVFEGISNLYSVFASINKEREVDLIVLACDSGSDKSFDFLGLAKLMEQVKETIIAIWDRRVFHRQKHASECLSLIAESLPVIQQIEEMKGNGSLGPEEAELLKRKTIDGATKFIEAGAIIQEMEGESLHSPRQLMRPEPKLLVSPWVNENPTTPHVATNLDAENESQSPDLSDKEVAELKALLKKAESGKTRKKRDSSKKPK